MKTTTLKEIDSSKEPIFIHSKAYYPQTGDKVSKKRELRNNLNILRESVTYSLIS